jgi:hypothetical protein
MKAPPDGITRRGKVSPDGVGNCGNRDGARPSSRRFASTGGRRARRLRETAFRASAEGVPRYDRKGPPLRPEARPRQGIGALGRGRARTTTTTWFTWPDCDNRQFEKRFRLRSKTARRYAERSAEALARPEGGGK